MKNLTYTLLFSLAVYSASCGSNKKDFLAEATAKSCVDFRIMLSHSAKKMLVPMNPNLESKEEWMEFCSCVGAVFEEEYSSGYNNAQLESLIKFQKDRHEAINKILKKRKKPVKACYDEQGHKDAKIIEKYLDDLDGNPTE